MLRAKFKTWTGPKLRDGTGGWGWVPCFVLSFRTSPQKASMQVVIALPSKDNEGGLVLTEVDIDSVRLLRSEVPLL